MQRFNTPRQCKGRPGQQALPPQGGAAAIEARLESRTRLDTIRTYFLTACVIAGLVACSKPAIDEGLEYPDTRISAQCKACPWNNTSGYDTDRIIDEAFLTSETYPNAWVDLIFVDDGTIYTSLINGRIDKR